MGIRGSEPNPTRSTGRAATSCSSCREPTSGAAPHASNTNREVIMLQGEQARVLRASSSGLRRLTQGGIKAAVPLPSGGSGGGASRQCTARDRKPC